MYNPIVRSNKIQSETSPKKSPFRGKIPEERQIQSRPILPNIKRSGPQAAAFVHRCAIFVWLEVLEGMISEFLLHPARQRKNLFKKKVFKKRKNPTMVMLCLQNKRAVNSYTYYYKFSISLVVMLTKHCFV